MSKIRPCALCKKRPRMTFVTTSDLCDICYDYAGWENTHSDECHEEFKLSDYGREVGAKILDSREACPICKGVPAPWTITEEPKMKNTKATAVSNPQTHTSHAACGHPRTPKARAACRKARARVAEIAALPEPVVSARLVTRKDAVRGSHVIVTRRDDSTLEGQLVSWGPQQLAIVPDAATQERLGRTWKRETVHVADLQKVCVIETA